MFSSRVPSDLEPNRLTQQVRRVRAARRDVLDLTVTNPTAAGIAYPPSILAPLADRAAERYEPHPLGLRSAREAIAGDYVRRGIDIATDRIVLTASTSEAYSILFKLLCDPAGDSVMVPVPSYPLFDHLTALDGVAPVAYPLEYHGRWAVDFETLDSRWTPRTRAVLAVSPNNPTGSVLTDAALHALMGRCADRDAALIIDEVFADYPLGTAPFPSGSRSSAALTFRLGGLSKSVGLPQVKLGWIAVGGPEALVHGAIERLELICDTYLSVSTPAQIAAPRMLSEGAIVRGRILERVRTNYNALRATAAAYPSIEPLHCDAGWSAVVRVPATRTEEDLVLELLERDGVLVHPGFFFDFDREAFLIVSLLAEPPVFLEGVRRMMERARV
jgi:hypothetical protein